VFVELCLLGLVAARQTESRKKKAAKQTESRKKKAAKQRRGKSENFEDCEMKINSVLLNVSWFSSLLTLLYNTTALRNTRHRQQQRDKQKAERKRQQNRGGESQRTLKTVR
jgi:hypothetical protein